MGSPCDYLRTDKIDARMLTVKSIIPGDTGNLKNKATMILVDSIEKVAGIDLRYELLSPSLLSYNIY